MRYEVVLFDLYGTLIDIHTDEQAAKPWQELWEFLDATGAHYDDAAHLKASFDQLNAVNVQEARKGAEHPDWVEPDVLPVFQRLYAAGGSMASPQLAAKAAWVFRKASTSKFGLYPGALEMLGKLREAGIRTVLASNAQACYTRPEIEATGLNKALDRIVISSEEGMRKPSPKFFLRALEYEYTTPDRALMVGNEERCDIQGAASAGIDGVYLHTAISRQDDPEICEQAVLSLNGADYGALTTFVLGE
ncbi:HAD family hydrolase [Bifidobacterium porcinum]|uniref:HAD family hydrolase n=1 Tax=Bifidobacterium porcinum TaxID=212365 RepID=UPI000529D30B|nr:HAD family hydrolase [Bifidobacterium porcinum]